MGGAARRPINSDGCNITAQPRTVNLSFIDLDHKSRRDSRERPVTAAGSQGWMAVSSEATDFVRGASYALLFGLLSWAIIGAASIEGVTASIIACIMA